MSVLPCVRACGLVSDGLDLLLRCLLQTSDVVWEKKKKEERDTRSCSMALLPLSWRLAAALALFCGPWWPQAHSALAPENEVPLRPTTWLPEGKITTVSLPKGRTRR